MPTFTTGDGVRLHYEDQGHGRPVVLVAGFCAPLESWELQRQNVGTFFNVIEDPDVLASLSRDDAEWAPAGTAIAAVRPRGTGEVSRIVAACAARRVPIVPRGAGTGLSGGANAVDGGLILDLSRMNRIVEIDAENMVAVVQPGVVNDELSRAVLAMPEAVKRTLDPLDLFNPGKVIGPP
ncbi:FAD-binding protein [Dactylosporangium sp. McL0621]|uniref:FAD-binding protein n=1 Tax=Dactylosporangium sp. McL0621 TaxID=3415678 RepID=UPI003CEF34F7